MFPIPLVVMDALPFTPLLLLTISLYTLGGVVYGFATEVWVVFAGRGVMGVAALMGSAIIHTYVGETGVYMDRIRERKGLRPRKGVLYIGVLFTTNTLQVLLLGELRTK